MPGRSSPGDRLRVRDAAPYRLVQLQGPSHAVSGATAITLHTLTAIERGSARVLGAVPTGSPEQRLAGIRGTLADIVRAAGSR